MVIFCCGFLFIEILHSLTLEIRRFSFKFQLKARITPQERSYFKLSFTKIRSKINPLIPKRTRSKLSNHSEIETFYWLLKFPTFFVNMGSLRQFRYHLPVRGKKSTQTDVLRIRFWTPHQFHVAVRNSIHYTMYSFTDKGCWDKIYFFQSVGRASHLMFDKHFMQKSMYKKARSDRFIFFSSMLLNVCSPRHEAHMIKKMVTENEVVNKGVLSQIEFSLNKQRQEDVGHNLISA